MVALKIRQSVDLSKSVICIPFYFPLSPLVIAKELYIRTSATFFFSVTFPYADARSDPCNWVH